MKTLVNINRRSIWRTISLVGILMFGMALVKAQTPKIDSLLKVLAVEHRDTTKIRLLTGLSWRLRDINEYDRSLVMAHESEQIARDLLKNKNLSSKNVIKIKNELAHAIAQQGNTYFEIPDHEKAEQCYLKALNLFDESKDTLYQAHMNNYLGMIYKGRGEYERSLGLYLNYLNLSKSINNKIYVADAFNSLALIYGSQGNYPKALELHFKALNNRDTITDKFGFATSYNNIGNIYKDQDESVLAKAYYLKALRIWEQLKKKRGIIASLNNIGLVYQYEKNNAKALEYFLKVYALLLQEDKNKKSGTLAGTLGNLANSYHTDGHLEKAMYFAVKAKEMFKELGDLPGEAISCNNIASIYLEQGKFKEALAYSEKSLNISTEIGSLDDMKLAEQTLSDIYGEMNEHRMALQHYKQYIIYRDSVTNEENTKKIVTEQMKYEFSIKEEAKKAEQDKKDLLVSEEKQKQKIIIVSVSSGLILVLILALVILKSLRENQKKNKIITEQKRLVEHQKELVDEKQKEILDSIYYARRIQRALITNEKYIEKCLSNGRQ